MLPEFDRIGLWSEVKLSILGEYAAPYSKIVTAKNFHHLYIDGFAGAGSHISRTSGELVPGSPQKALAIEPPFKEYHFIDKDSSRRDQLRSLAGKRDNVHIYAGDCNRVLLEEIFPRARYKDFRRALCVLDPYNIDISWEVVETAGRMRSIEIFVTFMVMDMNMNILLSDPNKATRENVARMDRFWGDDSWRDAVYEESRQTNLFGSPGTIKVDDANDKIAEAYRRRLLKVAGFEFAPSPLPLLNSRGATIYYLFFASPNRTGKKIVEEIFAKYREGGRS